MNYEIIYRSNKKDPEISRKISRGLFTYRFEKLFGEALLKKFGIKTLFKGF